MIKQPPLQQDLLQNTKSSSPWANWFSSLFGKNTWAIAPNLSGVAGDYTTSGYYAKTGDIVHYSILVTVNSGTITYTASDFIDNLPFEALEYGKQELFDLGDNQGKGSGVILKDTRNAYLIAHVSSNNVAIVGDYIAK